jgi:hypothetical protein
MPMPEFGNSTSRLFEDLHNAPSADAFARQLSDSARRLYGTPLQAFLERIVNEKASAVRHLQAHRDNFLGEDDAGQLKRRNGPASTQIRGNCRRWRAARSSRGSQCQIKSPFTKVHTNV